MVFTRVHIIPFRNSRVNEPSLTSFTNCFQMCENHFNRNSASIKYSAYNISYGILFMDSILLSAKMDPGY